MKRTTIGKKLLILFIKIGKRLRGVPVKGNCNEIPQLAEKYNDNGENKE